MIKKHSYLNANFLKNAHRIKHSFPTNCIQIKLGQGLRLPIILMNGRYIVVAFLGIDLGTGGVRCLLLDEHGFIIKEVSHSLMQINLSNTPGESEQNALDWTGSLEAAFDELFAVPKHRRISAVAVDSTSGTVLPVNRFGRPLGPALLHNDMRSKEEADACKNIFGGDCSPTFSLPKILWMQKHLTLGDDALFLHATDFLNAWLVGSVDIPTDFTNAMKTGVDLETGEWAENLPSVNLPKVVSPGQVVGEVSNIHRKRWGLSGPCRLVSGATDSNAAFYASGAGLVGEWSTTIGTTLAVKGLSGQRVNDLQGRGYCHRHPDGLWLPGGASNAGGEILKLHFGDQIGALETKGMVSTVRPAIVYPSIRRGERLPISDPSFIPFGLNKSEGELELFLGCLEGLSFVEKMTFDLLEELGCEVGPLVFATGGGASSSLGLQIRANVLQRSLVVPEHPHSAMGSAILAAAGFTSRKVGEVSKEMVKAAITINPVKFSDDSIKERFNLFRELCKQEKIKVNGP